MPAQRLAGLGPVRGSRGPRCEEMIEIPGKKYRVMRGEVTVGQFRKFVKESDYQITGDNARPLISLVKRGKAGASVDCINYEDAMAYIGWRNREPGREFRLLNMTELDDTYKILGAQLSVSGYELTSTLIGKKQNVVTSCDFVYHSHGYDFADKRTLGRFFRLAENIKA